MKKLLAFYLLAIMSPCILAQHASIFEKNSLFGLKDSNDKVILKASYDYIYPFKENHFLIEKERKIGLATQTGRIVFSPCYDEVQNFEDNYFMVLQNDKWGIVDMLNRPVLPIEYSNIERLSAYLYIVKSGEKKGLIDRYANIVIPPQYDEISSMSDNLLKIESGSKVGIIDNTGNMIISPDNYQKLEKLPNFNLYCVNKNDKYGIIDMSGKMIVEPVLDEIDSIGNNLYITVKKDGKYGFIVNKKYIPAIYDRVIFAQDDLGVIAVRQGKLNGFITIYGLVIPPIYDNISRFSANGHAFVEKKGKLMFVDLNGKERTLQEVTGGGNL